MSETQTDEGGEREVAAGQSAAARSAAAQSAITSSDGQRRDVPAKIIALACAVREQGGRALLVGGCVRDLLLERAAKDWDVEVYGVEPVALRSLLERFGKVNTVGEAFTVYKIGRHIDVSLPRRERKQGRGHRGFHIEGDPSMSFAEAARRRDFTINAILQDPLTGEIIDPFNGQTDLQRGVLRHVAAETFIEDSLRVLRAAQFAARFRLMIDAETIRLCRSIRLDDLPGERIWGELEKLLLQAARPAIGLGWLRKLNATAQLFPELAALNEEREAHIFRTVDHARTLLSDLPYPKQVTVMLAALCHRLSASDTERLLDRLKIYTLEGYDARAQILALVREQKRPFDFYDEHGRVTDGDFRRLSLRCQLALLYRLSLACAVAAMDEKILQRRVRAAEWFIKRASSLEVEEQPPAPLLMGRHLLEMGLKPSPRIGEITAAVYELQLDGRIETLEEAQAAARRMLM